MPLSAPSCARHQHGRGPCWPWSRRSGIGLVTFPLRRSRSSTSHSGQPSRNLMRSGWHLSSTRRLRRESGHRQRERLKVIAAARQISLCNLGVFVCLDVLFFPIFILGRERFEARQIHSASVNSLRDVRRRWALTHKPEVLKVRLLAGGTVLLVHGRAILLSGLPSRSNRVR
jgi:hypothetical protein